MRLFFVITLILGIVLFSCEKDNLLGLKRNDQPSLIDTTIYSFDTLNISFGYFGDEEGISIVSRPANSKFCELLNKQWEERILRYIPQDNFLGIDSTVVVTMKGSDGASPPTDIDTILIVIKVVKDDFHRGLIGKWNWTSSCGGFTGGCWYPSEGHYEHIEFYYNMRYIEKYNDSIVRDFQYHFIQSFISGQNLIYEIGFDNGYDTFYMFIGDKLNVQGGDFWKEYERIE